MRRVLRAVYPVLHRLRVAYWRAARPRTHGVRVVIGQPGTGAVLLVRHTYGQRAYWFPPGGGFNPARESAVEAARREVREEVGITLGPLTELGVYRTEAGGNRDTVLLFSAVARSTDIRPSAEIADFRWIAATAVAPDMALAPVTRHALAQAPRGDGRADAGPA